MTKADTVHGDENVLEEQTVVIENQLVQHGIYTKRVVAQGVGGDGGPPPQLVPHLSMNNNGSSPLLFHKNENDDNCDLSDDYDISMNEEVEGDDNNDYICMNEEGVDEDNNNEDYAIIVISFNLNFLIQIVTLK